MKCPKCQTDNGPDDSFCRKCGTKLEMACAKCGRTIPPDSSFCPKCGHDLRKPSAPSTPIDYSQPQSYTPKYLADKILTTRSSIEGERKLVTVLFADVANYTSIAEKLDPEEVHQIMDGCFKILMDEIHRYEGTINQFTGDGVMALFGAPLAHEDHAQRACHAALAIQKAIQGYGEKVKRQHRADFKLRIGLNSGPVVVGRIGDDLRMDYTAVGDTTNLASRLQQLASPGSILVSTHTHRLARDFFEFASQGKVAIKGKEKPQEAYELIRPSEVETRIEAAAAKGLTRFVGRRKEMEALREAFDKARSGSGQVIGIVGEAGVGKSRLLLELRGMLPQDEYSYLEHRCLHYGGSMPYLPVVEALKAYFDIEDEDREATIKKKIRDRLREFDGKLEVVPPSLHEVLSLKVEDERYLQLGPQQRRERTFEAIRDLLIRESQRRPLVLAFEDVHWIDKTSQEFLDYLIGFLPTARILLILLYRPEYTHTWGSKSYYGKIGLDQLPAQRSAELVQAIFEGGDVAPEIAALVLGRAGGNPLFVEELTHSLVENGSIQRKDDRFVLAQKPSEIEVPDTIQGIIAARMDRIEDNLKRIMQVASVIGREFAYRILQSIAGTSEDLKASLLNLQGLEFIYEKQLFPELEYIFKHALTQEVAYHSLLLKRRKEIHERIGQTIEQLYSERLEEYYELLAYHYMRSDNKQKAVEYVDLANQKTAGVYALEDAKGYFDLAMNLLDNLEDTKENLERRVSLILNQALVYHMLFQLPEYYELLKRYEPVVNNLKNEKLEAFHCAALGDCEWSFGLFDKAVQSGKRGVDLSLAAGNLEIASMAYVVLQQSYYSKGDYEKALECKEQALRILDQCPNLAMHVAALSEASWAYTSLGRWEDAEREAKAALDLAEEHSDNSWISFAAMSLSLVYTFKGDLDKGIEYGELAVTKAPTPGNRLFAQYSLAWTLCRAGQSIKENIGLLNMTLDLARAGRFVVVEPTVLGMLSEAFWLVGDYENARETAETLQELCERCGDRFHLGFAHRILGEVSLATNPVAAASHFEKAISIFQEIKAENELAVTYSGMGRYLTKALQIFERLGTLIEPDKVREELAELG